LQAGGFSSDNAASMAASRESAFPADFAWLKSALALILGAPGA
jgi:hypothetical protein